MVADVHYALSDGLHIAYRADGHGPADLVVCEPGLASFDHLGEIPAWESFVDRLARFSRVIQFDRRGTGLSDRPATAETAPLEARVDDLGAVLDALGTGRAAVFGIAAGTWAAALYAASHPDRVSALILHRPLVCGLRAADYPWGTSLEEQASYEALVRSTWGTREYGRWDLERIAPSLAGDIEMQSRWGAMSRRSATIAEELHLSRLETEMDVRSVLPAIRVPTLVLSRGRNPDEARYVAARIPGAELVELDGRDMAPFAGDQDAVPSAIRRFLQRLDADVEPERVLATALFTDIVGSTERLQAVGDREWRRLVEGHHAIVRGQLARFRGHEIDTAGDGFLASFDGPARALRCACRIRDAVGDLGLEVRAGLHTGEFEQADGKLVGVALNTAARIAGEAEPSEILVSSTVRELVAGGQFELADRGDRALKGLGDWHLYAAHERSDPGP